MPTVLTSLYCSGLGSDCVGGIAAEAVESATGDDGGGVESVAGDDGEGEGRDDGVGSAVGGASDDVEWEGGSGDPRASVEECGR